MTPDASTLPPARGEAGARPASWRSADAVEWSHGRRLDLLLGLCLAMLAVAVYANAVRNGFALDDVQIVQKNAFVHDPARYLGRLLLGSYWPESKELYRPVTLLSLAVDWRATGGSTWWLHAHNVLLHGAVVVLVFALARRMGAPRWPAAAGALVFAVHPVHVEAVAGVVGRAEVLCAVLLLAACHLHLSPRSTRAWAVAATAALYLAALGAKEIAVTLPALLLLLDLFGDRERGAIGRVLRRRWPLMGAMAAALAVFLALRVNAIGAVGGTAPAPFLRDLGTSARIATGVRLWPEYLRLLFWPADLSSEWAPGAIPVASWSEPLVYLALALGAALAGLAVADRRRGAGWGWLAVTWFALAVLPVSQLPFAIGTMLAERTLYVPSLALVFVVIGLLGVVPLRTPRWAAAALVAAACVALAGRTWTRTPVWRDSHTVDDDMRLHHPEVWRSLWRKARNDRLAGDMPAAVYAFTRAVNLTDANVGDLDVDAGNLLLTLGFVDEAEGLFRQAARVEPTHPEVRIFLAELMIERGRDAEALAFARELLQRDAHAPGVAPAAHHLAALALDAAGRRAEAWRHNTQALNGAPPRARGAIWLHTSRLAALAGQGDAARAAMDSARAAGAAAELKDGVPALSSPALRGWPRMMGGAAPAGPPPHSP